VSAATAILQMMDKAYQAGRTPMTHPDTEVECYRFEHCHNVIRREVDDVDYTPGQLPRASYRIVDNSGAECACGNFFCREQLCGTFDTCSECMFEADCEYGTP
jgi:hypothetical protein